MPCGEGPSRPTLQMGKPRHPETETGPHVLPVAGLEAPAPGSGLLTPPAALGACLENRLLSKQLLPDTDPSSSGGFSEGKEVPGSRACGDHPRPS